MYMINNYIAFMLFLIQILFVAMYNWQVVPSLPHELAQCFIKALSPHHPPFLPFWAEQNAQAYVTSPSPESSEDPSNVHPVIKRYFDLSVRNDITHFDNDSSSSE